MRTRQKCVATDTWRFLGCRTTPLEHWSRRKPTVEPRWAKQQTKKIRPNLFILVSWGRSFLVCCLAHWGSTVLFFLVCSSVPVVLFDTPGISRCPSQHVDSVESSSLFHHSIYLWFICFPWWSIDELENLHADRTTVCFKPWQKPRTMLGSR